MKLPRYILVTVTNPKGVEVKIDAKELVMCKDCIHKYERPMFRWNEAYCTCGFTDERYNPNGFCYHGERLGE